MALQYRLPHRTVAAVFVTALLTASCDSKPPTSYEEPQLQDRRVGVPARGFVHCETASSREASAVIGPEGGTLTVGSTVILFPSEAVPTPQRFTARTVAGTTLRVRITARGHEHYRFARPIAVMIGYGHCSRQNMSANLSVWHVEDSSDVRLELMPSITDVANATVGFLTTHLSTYAIAN